MTPNRSDIASPFRSDLTVVIITKNEERNIGSIVSSWTKLAPVLVVDSGSWDQTVEKAELNGARVISQPWMGYGRQKQFAVNSAVTDWVLSIDADEWPSNKLLESLKCLDLKEPNLAFKLRRQTYFLGSRVKHCGWGDDEIVRLFNRKEGHFDDRIVHEKVVHNCRTTTLAGKINHHSYPDMRSVKRKIAKYARLSATLSQEVNNRPRVAIKRAVGPFWSAFKTLVLKAGILDGWTGLQIARMNATATARKYQLIQRFINNRQVA